MTPYEQGFRKRAEDLGVDPDCLVKEGGQLLDWLTGKLINGIDSGYRYMGDRTQEGWARAKPRVDAFRRRALAALAGTGDGSMPLLERFGSGVENLYNSARKYYDRELRPFGEQVSKSISDIGDTSFWKNSVVPAGKSIVDAASRLWGKARGFMDGKLPFND